jgi:hypothetical protein
MKNVEEVEALVEAARELTDLHYAAFRKDELGDGITIFDSDAEYCEQFPKWVNMAAALKPWTELKCDECGNPFDDAEGATCQTCLDWVVKG